MTKEVGSRPDPEQILTKNMSGQFLNRNISGQGPDQKLWGSEPESRVVKVSRIIKLYDSLLKIITVESVPQNGQSTKDEISERAHKKYLRETA